MQPVTIELSPSDKYWRVIDPVERVHAEDTDYQDWSGEDKEAADAFIETVDEASTTETFGDEPDGLDTLTWGNVTPASDPDLLSKIATYFDGMSPDEPKDRLRAKLRLLDVEKYVNAQIAAKAELRE